MSDNPYESRRQVYAHFCRKVKPARGGGVRMKAGSHDAPMHLDKEIIVNLVRVK